MHQTTVSPFAGGIIGVDARAKRWMPSPYVE